MQTVFINTPAELETLATRLAGAPLLAVDTEFVRVSTFHPQLGLIQIGDRDHEYLIDPLAVGDLSALRPLLLAEYPRKVLHACSEDIEVLARLAGAYPRGILDTQIAAAFLGQGLQLGYQKSLQEFLGIDIPKDESRSDWLARPLTPAQVEYAALDVRFLPRLYDRLHADLGEKGLVAWFEADCRLMLQDIEQLQQQDPETVYRDVSNAWKLRTQELGILKALTVWREQEARARDLPRGFLIRNASLFHLARRQPSSMAQLADIEDMTPRILRKEGEAILHVIAEAKRLPADARPPRLPQPLPREAREVFDALKAAASRVAEQYRLPLEVLLRKKHLEALVLGVVDQGFDTPLPAALEGWRGEVLTPVLMDALLPFRSELQAWKTWRWQTVTADIS